MTADNKPISELAPDEQRANNALPHDAHKKAVALEYKAKDRFDVPRIKAKGQGYIAERIVDVALAENIPVIEDADMVEMLSALDVGSDIPPEAFVAVAQIIRYIYDKGGQSLPEFNN